MWWWIVGALTFGATVIVYSALVMGSMCDDQEERIRDEMARRDAVARAVEAARLRD
jgi:putative exporter of polyketide antibiotics